MSEAGLIHATSIAIDGRGVLLSGGSGSGKSDLALRLIDRGAMLISDDYTRLDIRDGVLHAFPALNIAGRIEVRGVGIEDMAFFAAGTPVALILALDEMPDRLPPDPVATRNLLGCAVPLIPLAPFEASAPIKAELALRDHGLRIMP